MVKGEDGFDQLVDACSPSAAARPLAFEQHLELPGVPAPAQRDGHDLPDELASDLIGTIRRFEQVQPVQGRGPQTRHDRRPASVEEDIVE
jgi:hypothetical protein